MRNSLHTALFTWLAVCLVTPSARADELPLDKPADLETEASLAEAKRVEAELKAALEKVRAQRAAIEERIRTDSISKAPERTVSDARIVNGVTTWAFPATGALIKGTNAGAAESWCTGTLIGCRTFLTANHCVEDDRDPSRYHVFLQAGGIHAVESISAQRADYRFPQGDLAVIRLAQPVEGIAPVALNTTAIANGTSGTIVGFGRSGGVRSDYGVKRTGRVVTAACDRPETSLLCWDFNAPAGVPGENSNTCNADSGGPLFVTPADGSLLLAGVTSGGTKSTCLTGDHSYDVDVQQFVTWIREQAGTDLGTASCGNTTAVGSPGTAVLGAGGRLTSGQGSDYRFPVPSGVARLRVALNAEDQPSTNVDLFVKRGSVARPQAADCSANGSGNYGFCQFEAPQAGPWFLHLKQGSAGDGDFQVVVTMLSPRP